jgi:hypothetical protein
MMNENNELKNDEKDAEIKDEENKVKPVNRKRSDEERLGTAIMESKKDII